MAAGGGPGTAGEPGGATLALGNAVGVDFNWGWVNELRPGPGAAPMAVSGLRPGRLGLVTRRVRCNLSPSLRDSHGFELESD